jgi:hypothetical protein
MRKSMIVFVIAAVFFLRYLIKKRIDEAPCCYGCEKQDKSCGVIMKNF